MKTDVRPGLARLMAQEGEPRTPSPVRDIQDQLDAALQGAQDASDGQVSLPGIVSETGLQLPPGLTFEQWQQVGFTLRRINRAWRWWVGDWLNYGERAYGEMYSQAMDETGLAYNQLAQIAHVARKIEPEMRHEALSWSHHAAVARLDKVEANALLDRAEEHGWQRKDLRAAADLLTGGNNFTPAETSSVCSCHCCQSAICPDCGHKWGE